MGGINGRMNARKGFGMQGGESGEGQGDSFEGKKASLRSAQMVPEV